MLVEAELAAGPQHALELGQRRGLIGHGAQDAGDDHGVGRARVDRELIRDPVDDADLELERPGRSLGRLAQVGSGSTVTSSETDSG